MVKLVQLTFLLNYELQSSEVIRLPTLISKYIILGSVTLLPKIPTASVFSKLEKMNLSALKLQSPLVAVESDVQPLSVGSKAGNSMTLYSHKSDGWVNQMSLETTVPLTKENIFSVCEQSQNVVSTIDFG